MCEVCEKIDKVQESAGRVTREALDIMLGSAIGALSRAREEMNASKASDVAVFTELSEALGACGMACLHNAHAIAHAAEAERVRLSQSN